MQDLNIFILAGGKSSRMRSALTDFKDKAFLELKGRTLLARAMDVALSVTGDKNAVWIGGAREKFGEYARVVEDIFPDRGPLGGIHAALRATTTELNLMLAVDVPFVAPEFLRYLVSRASASDAPVTVPRTDCFHPLCAVYRRSFAHIAEQALKSGHNKIDALFKLAPTQIIEQEEMERLGFDPKMLQNLNTPADFQRAAGL